MTTFYIKKKSTILEKENDQEKHHKRQVKVQG